MKFTKDHKAIIKTLTREEAREFLNFLEDEIKRHNKCVEEADFMWSMRPIISEVYEHATLRHGKDIWDTLKTLKKVKEMFNL